MKPFAGFQKACPAWLPPLLGGAALVPFLAQYGYFRQLFYFGDEFPLINEINTQPFGHWLWYPFVENILPLFKLCWGGVIVKGSGAYLDLLWAAWMVHACTVGLMGAWMRRAGFGWSSVAVCGSIFAWSASQVETLTWTVQVSSEMATLFFVAGCLMLPEDENESWSAGRIFGLFLFSTASAWSFARGLLTGPVLALTVLVPPARAGRFKNWVAALVCLVPTVATALLMIKGAPENSRHLAGEITHWRAVAGFALCYLGGSPALPYWFSTAHASAFDVSVRTVVIAGGLKLILLGLGWAWATRRQRRLLFAAFILDAAYAALLGLGRWEGDWHYAMGSRYQYNSLLCTLPFAGVCLEHAVRRRAWAGRTAGLVTALIIGVFGAYSFYGWSREMPVWGEWRGLRNRHLLVGSESVPSGADVEALPSFPNARAKQLVEVYHLH